MPAPNKNISWVIDETELLKGDAFEHLCNICLCDLLTNEELDNNE